MKIDLSKVFELVENLIPQVAVNGIKIEGLTLIKKLNVKVGNTEKVYNSININIGTIGNQNDPLAIVSPKQLAGEIEPSIAFLPKNASTPEENPTIDIQNIPFSSGFHLIINQKSWWSQKNSNPVFIGQIQLIPICQEKESYIKTLKSQNGFFLEIKRTGELCVEIWAGEEKKIITNLPAQVKEPRSKGSFSFREYRYDDIITFESFPEIVISLDKTVVEKAILVKYEPEDTQSEYFVFILAQD